MLDLQSCRICTHTGSTHTCHCVPDCTKQTLDDVSIQAWCAVLLQLGFVIAMVTGIHFVEAYLLNPAIYSANLHLHPLLVISTLVVAEHSLGVWGLLLAGDMPSDCSANLSCSCCASLVVLASLMPGGCEIDIMLVCLSCSNIHACLPKQEVLLPCMDSCSTCASFC